MAFAMVLGPVIYRFKEDRIVFNVFSPQYMFVLLTDTFYKIEALGGQASSLEKCIMVFIPFGLQLFIFYNFANYKNTSFVSYSSSHSVSFL